MVFCSFLKAASSLEVFFCISGRHLMVDGDGVGVAKGGEERFGTSRVMNDHDRNRKTRYDSAYILFPSLIRGLWSRCRGVARFISTLL